MNQIKKTGILAGAVVGGIIGGALSVVGKVARVKLVDDIGESIVDSAILTGAMAGKLISGAGNVITGTLGKHPRQVREGSDDLRDTGKQVIDNVTRNVRLVVGSGKEITGGIRHRNPRRIKAGAKRFVKLIAVGALTVGAISIKDDGDSLADSAAAEARNPLRDPDRMLP